MNETSSAPADDTPLPLEGVVEKYPNIDRLLDVRCPVIVILAEKVLTFGDVLNLDVGSIIVFAKHNSDPVELRVNNVKVGSGKTIKVADHFGIHLRNYSQESVVKAVL